MCRPSSRCSRSFFGRARAERLGPARLSRAVLPRWVPLTSGQRRVGRPPLSSRCASVLPSLSCAVRPSRAWPLALDRSSPGTRGLGACGLGGDAGRKPDRARAGRLCEVPFMPRMKQRACPDTIQLRRRRTRRTTAMSPSVMSQVPTKTRRASPGRIGLLCMAQRAVVARRGGSYRGGRRCWS